jgi:hypothetical protein
MLVDRVAPGVQLLRSRLWLSRRIGRSIVRRARDVDRPRVATLSAKCGAGCEPEPVHISFEQSRPATADDISPSGTPLMEVVRIGNCRGRQSEDLQPEHDHGVLTGRCCGSNDAAHGAGTTAAKAAQVAE